VFAVLDFFVDVFSFFRDDEPKTSSHAESDSSPVEDAAHDVFDAWQDNTSDVFDFLHDAAKPWGDPAQDFVDAWRDATESFASSYANWWGWQNDDSPV
jgi:hypothetical protein